MVDEVYNFLMGKLDVRLQIISHLSIFPIILHNKTSGDVDRTLFSSVLIWRLVVYCKHRSCLPWDVFRLWGTYGPTTPHPQEAVSWEKSAGKVGLSRFLERTPQSSHFWNHRDLVLQQLEGLETTNQGLAGTEKNSCLPLEGHFLAWNRGAKEGTLLWPKECEGKQDFFWLYLVQLGLWGERGPKNLHPEIRLKLMVARGLEI